MRDYIRGHASKLIVMSQFYFSMFLVYSLLAIAWGWLCYQNLQDLLPIQVSHALTIHGQNSQLSSITFPVYLAS